MTFIRIQTSGFVSSYRYLYSSQNICSRLNICVLPLWATVQITIYESAIYYKLHIIKFNYCFSWASTSPARRSAILMKIADLIEEKLEEFAKAESKDQGKPIWLARKVDIPRVVHNFRFFSTAILHFGNE